MYWKVTHEPTKQSAIDAIKADPSRSYLDATRFDRFYKYDDNRIRDYVEYSKTYEYLAFLFALQKMGISDPLGPQWFPNWVRDLVQNIEFIDVNDQYRDFYPDFANFVDNIKRDCESKGAFKSKVRLWE